MNKNKLHTIHKFTPETTEVRVGEVWLVQIEPITLGSPVRKMRIEEVTDITIVLIDTGHKLYMTGTRYPHYSVRFLEKAK